MRREARGPLWPACFVYCARLLALKEEHAGELSSHFQEPRAWQDSFYLAATTGEPQLLGGPVGGQPRSGVSVSRGRIGAGGVCGLKDMPASRNSLGSEENSTTRNSLASIIQSRAGIVAWITVRYLSCAVSRCYCAL